MTTVSNTLLSAVTANTVGTGVQYSYEAGFATTFKLAITATGAFTASVMIQSSIDNLNWSNLKVWTQQGNTSFVDSFSAIVPLDNYFRAVVGGISGTSTAVTVTAVSTTLAQTLAPIVLEQSGFPMVLPSSGTIGNNGALSAITALPTTYANCYMYFPANAIATGVAAGMYYVVMSSTTAGTIYNNTYTSGDPVIPANPIPFVTTGPGAYTQTTGAPITLSTNTLPANSLGTDGQIFAWPVFSHTSSVNNKILAGTLGGTTAWTATVTSTATSSYYVRISNRQNAASQVSVTVGAFGASATALTYLTKDTTTDLVLARTAQLANAAEYIVLESTQVQVIYAD